MPTHLMLDIDLPCIPLQILFNFIFSFTLYSIWFDFKVFLTLLLLAYLPSAAAYQRGPWNWKKGRLPEKEKDARKLRRAFHETSFPQYFTVTTMTFSISLERAARFSSSSRDLMASYICSRHWLIEHLIIQSIPDNMTPDNMTIAFDDSFLYQKGSS